MICSYRKFLFIVLTLLALDGQAQLKSVVYDFDGLDIGSADLPEGDYGAGDLSYEVAGTPAPVGEVLGDRVLKCELNWSTNQGAFGRGISRYVELDPSKDRLNFYFFNPSGTTVHVDVMIGDDDNNSLAFEAGADDYWRKTLSIPATNGWQFFSIPLNDFEDSNTGGNNAFDIAFSANKGMLLNVEFRFFKPSGVNGSSTYYLDFISFSEGALPTGASVFDLPGKGPGDYCLLGAFTNEKSKQYHLTPGVFEGMFPKESGKKIRYVNTFLKWTTSGTTPDVMPGAAAQTLVDNGYRPILTWEPMFEGYARLDPVQPRLNDILSGKYDSYIDAFADAVKNISDTVIIRLMHEFEGDWYSWSIVHNGEDPQRYISTFRHFVNRFRARGANNVKWMWCVNSDYAPYRHYNWIVSSYPGDNYVDIVATDIYNNHFPQSLPWWRSFKWQTAESYYYLNKYFPNKPLYICEVGCRERLAGENTGSQSKGAWFERMDRELQGNFNKARALVFFHAAPDQNWFVNSSGSALQSLVDHVWNDDYYFHTPAPTVTKKDEEQPAGGLYIYPNPTDAKATLHYVSASEKEDIVITVTHPDGKQVYQDVLNFTARSFTWAIDLGHLQAGIYSVEISSQPKGTNGRKRLRVVKKLVVL